MRIETPAQWLEHSDAWRYAHLDMAPSESLRRMAIQEHDRRLQAMTAPTMPSDRWLSRLHKRKRRP